MRKVVDAGDIAEPDPDDDLDDYHVNRVY